MTPTEELFSESREHKAVIVRRDDGLFSVGLFRRHEEELPEPGRVETYWAPVGRDLTLTDTLEAARARAREKLAGCA